MYTFAKIKEVNKQIQTNLSKINNYFFPKKLSPNKEDVKSVINNFENIQKGWQQHFWVSWNPNKAIKRESFKSFWFARSLKLHYIKFKENHSKYINVLNKVYAVDLHRLTVSEAEEIVTYLLELINAENEFCFIRIITGKGLHSRNGRAKLAPMVKNMIKKTDSIKLLEGLDQKYYGHYDVYNKEKLYRFWRK